MDRRRFFAAAAAVAGAARSVSAKPVRDIPLHASYFGPLYYDEKERQELIDVVETGRPFRWYGPGSQPPAKVLTFEKELAQWTHTRYALAVTSGTAALQTAIAALGIGPGDEVILPAWTWHSCFNAIVLAGALPVFAEIDEILQSRPGGYRAPHHAAARSSSSPCICKAIRRTSIASCPSPASTA